MTDNEQQSLNGAYLDACVENHAEKVEATSDELLSQAGGCGTFQFLVVLIGSCIQFGVAYQTLNLYFVGQSPPWRCINDNVTQFCSDHPGQVFDVEHEELFKQRCSMNRSDWQYTIPRNWSIVTEYDLVCENTLLSALANSAFFVGWGLGGIPMGLISDRYGRKNVMFLCLLIFAGCSEALAFVKSSWQFIGIRFLVGLAYSGAATNVFVFMSEFLSSKHRSTGINIGMAAFTSSLFALTGLSYYERRWRWQEIYSASPAILTLLFYFSTPESARWLVSTNQTEKAEKIFYRIGRMNGKDVSHFKLASPVTTLTGKKYTYLDLFRQWKVARIVLSVAYLWLSTGLAYYALSFESSQLGGNMYMNFALSSIIEIPATLMCAVLCDKFGRKKTILSSLVAVSFSCLAIGFIPLSKTGVDARIGLAMSGKFFIVIAFNGLYIWTCEVFPTVVRTQGMGICQMTSRVGSVSAPFVVELLGQVYAPLPYLLITGITFLASIIGLVLDETNKKPNREKFEDIFTTSTENDGSEIKVKNDDDLTESEDEDVLNNQDFDPLLPTHNKSLTAMA